MDSHLEGLLRRILGTDPQGDLRDEHREKFAMATLALAPRETYEAVWRFANSISDEAKRSFLLHKLSALIAERFEYDLSEKIARTIPLAFWRYDALIKIAQELLKREEMSRKVASYKPQYTQDAFRLLLEAEQNLQRIPEDDRPSIIWSGGLALVGVGELDWAERLATSPQYCPENTEVLLRVARAHADRGNTNHAIKIVRGIAELSTASDPDLTHRAFDLADVGELVFDHGDKPEALRYFEEAIRLATSVQEAGDMDGSKCLVGLAVTFAKRGQLDRAREIANKITSAYFRDWAFEKIQESTKGSD